MRKLDCQSILSSRSLDLSRLSFSMDGRPTASFCLSLSVSRPLSFVRSGKTHRSNDGVTAMVGNKVLDGAGGSYVEVVATDKM